MISYHADQLAVSCGLPRWGGVHWHYANGEAAKCRWQSNNKQHGSRYTETHQEPVRRNDHPQGAWQQARMASVLFYIVDEPLRTVLAGGCAAVFDSQARTGGVVHSANQDERPTKERALRVRAYADPRVPFENSCQDQPGGPSRRAGYRNANQGNEPQGRPYLAIALNEARKTSRAGRSRP